MAKADVQMPDEFLSKLSSLGDHTDTIAEKALEAGGQIVAARVRGNLASVIGRGLKIKGRSTGQLLGSLGVSSMKVDGKGDYNVKVGFAEPRRGGGSNAKLANILEYGKHGQPAKPFLKPAKSASRAACIAAMKAVFEQECGS